MSAGAATAWLDRQAHVRLPRQKNRERWKAESGAVTMVIGVFDQVEFQTRHGDISIYSQGQIDHKRQSGT